MDGSSTIEQPEPTTRKASSLTAAQRAPLSVSSAALASVFDFFLSCFLETCSTGMFLTAGALKSIFLLVCHRLNGATIERFAMHRSKRLEAKSITDQMIRFRRSDPQRLCTVPIPPWSTCQISSFFLNQRKCKKLVVLMSCIISRILAVKDILA